MLLQLMPDQTVRLWGEIKPYVTKALPVEERSPEVLGRVLENISANLSHCWLSYDANDPNKYPNAVALTAAVRDVVTGGKNMLLYGVTRILELDEETTKQMWAEAFVAVSKHALKHGCSKIIATTELDYIVDLAKQFGGNIRSLIAFQLGDSDEGNN